MFRRFAILLIVPLVVAGGFMLDKLMMPEPPVAPAKPPAAAPAQAPEPVATAPSQEPKPVVTARTEPAPPPVAAAPAEQTPIHIVTAPLTQERKPVVTEPPAPAPKPVVTIPPAPAPKPVVAALPPQEQKPVVSAPPASAPATVVAALPPEQPAAPIINPPLPLKRPVITEMTIPAKALFVRAKLPSVGPSRAIGYYPRGCLQGGVELPPDGPHWEVMRPARNRNWGHPELVTFLERFSRLAAKATGWPGILVGDMAQPRGGPLPYGHASHQVGLDVDIWYSPMPDHRLTEKQRNEMPPLFLVAPDRKHVNAKTWTPADAAFIRTAAEQPEVERIFVNAAIKKQLCHLEGKHHYTWMDKVRPWYGHDDHMHVRLKCPADSPHCRHQPPVPASDDCSEKALAYWFSDRVLHPKPSPKPAKPPKQITLADMPAACKTVLDAPAKHTDLTAIER